MLASNNSSFLLGSSNLKHNFENLWSILVLLQTEFDSIGIWIKIPGTPKNDFFEFE